MIPDEPTTQELRTIFSARASEDAERAGDADAEAERRTHERRSQKAAYLQEKLAEQEASENADD